MFLFTDQRVLDLGGLKMSKVGDNVSSSSTETKTSGSQEKEKTEKRNNQKPGNNKVQKIDVKPQKQESKTVKESKIENKTEKLDIKEEDTEFLMGHCGRLRHKLWFQIMVFMVVVCLDGVDLVTDWLLFRDVIMAEEGLVYGPPEDALTFSLLAFSIIGTLTFIFEISNLWWEIFRENPWINSDFASCITIWIEDVPQIVINVLLVVCREEAISYFQLVKACLMILGIVIRIIVSLIRYCSKKSLAETKIKTRVARRHVAYRVIIMIGLIIIFAGAIAVFFLTQFERKEDGKIEFNTPKSLFEGKYNDERYFHNVSMYFNHPLFNYDNTGDTANINWIRLISIYDVREKREEVFKLEYDEATKKNFVLWQTNGNKVLERQECYTVDRTAKTVTKASKSCATFLTGPTSFFVFKFVFINPSIPNLLFGDIKFNCKVNESGAGCHGPTSNIVIQVRDRLNPGSSLQNAVIHYYRTKDSVSEDHHLVWSGSGTRFFKNEDDLIDITTVWKTGFGSCESSGSLAPHNDASVAVDCNP